MSATQNKESVKRLYDELNRGNFAIVDELLLSGIQDHASHGTTSGLEAFKQFSAVAGAAFPDMQFHVADVIAEGDKVVARGTLSGTNTGPWMGRPATNKPINIGWTAIYRFEGGKIAERWLNGDDLAMMQQLGLIPAAG